MSILDPFKVWLRGEVRHIDRNIEIDTENAADYLKQRTAIHVSKMHRDVENFFERMLAEQKHQEDKPLTFESLPASAPAALAAPVMQEPEVRAPAAPSEVAATEWPAPEPEQAAPAEIERPAAPKAKKKAAPVKQKVEAPTPAMSTESPAPKQVAPSSEIMDDAVLAALIQKDRLAGGKKK
jgi:hypothetical protein